MAIANRSNSCINTVYYDTKGSNSSSLTKEMMGNPESEEGSWASLQMLFMNGGGLTY